MDISRKEFDLISKKVSELEGKIDAHEKILETVHDFNVISALIEDHAKSIIKTVDKLRDSTTDGFLQVKEELDAVIKKTTSLQEISEKLTKISNADIA